MKCGHPWIVRLLYEEGRNPLLAIDIHVTHFLRIGHPQASTLYDKTLPSTFSGILRRPGYHPRRTVLRL